MEINYELLDQQIQELPVDLFEKIRRLTYRKQNMELLNDIISHYTLTNELDQICGNVKTNNKYFCLVLKCMDFDNNKIIPYKYSFIKRIKRLFKYRNVKDFILIDKYYSFGTLWNILNENEKTNFIKMIKEIPNY